MIIFPTGIKITEAEQMCLLHVEVDPEQWLRDAIAEKVRLRRGALINEWRPKLFADPTVTSIPADAAALVQLIVSRADYKSRAQADAELSISPSLHNIARFEGVSRKGKSHRRPDRDLTGATVTLFPAGLIIPDMDATVILAYVQDLEDWVLGALLGHINRGKKKMIRQYHPVMMDDPDVTSIPANEDDLIDVITSRSDYRTLPDQASERAQQVQR